MTTPQTIIDNLAPVLAEIAATAAQREQDREFSRDLAKQLSAGGFTKLRIPIEFGGLGFSLPEAFEVLVAVAAADSNIAQGLRPHFLAVESLLIAPDSEHRTKWLRKIAEEGVVIGNALTEVGNKPGELKTKIRKTARPLFSAEPSSIPRAVFTPTGFKYMRKMRKIKMFSPLLIATHQALFWWMTGTDLGKSSPPLERPRLKTWRWIRGGSFRALMRPRWCGRICS